MLKFFEMIFMVFNDIWVNVLGKIEIDEGVSFASFILVGIVIAITINVFWRGAKK